MLMILTSGINEPMDPYLIYRYGDVELTLQPMRNEMAFGYLAWMIQGWLNLMGMYGWWEERIELRDMQLGVLAVGTIGKNNY